MKNYGYKIRYTQKEKIEIAKKAIELKIKYSLSTEVICKRLYLNDTGVLRRILKSLGMWDYYKDLGKKNEGER